MLKPNQSGKNLSNRGEFGRVIGGTDFVVVPNYILHRNNKQLVFFKKNLLVYMKVSLSTIF